MTSSTSRKRKFFFLSGALGLSLAACADSEPPPLEFPWAPKPDAGEQPPSEEPSEPEEDGSTPGPIDRPDGSADYVDAGPAGMVPAPPPYAIHVPEYDQPEGDPDRGYDYLINGEYQRLGPDLAAFKAAQPAGGERIGEHRADPPRRARNEDPCIGQVHR